MELSWDVARRTPLSELRTRAGLTSRKQVLAATVAGKAAQVVWRQRRLAGRGVRSLLADRRERSAAPQLRARRAVRSVFLIPIGPGMVAELADTIDAVRAYEGESAQIVVLDDATVDGRASVLRERWPEVHVVRSPWPSATVFRQYPRFAAVLREALELWDFDVYVKLDVDALVTGPGLIDACARRFEAEPDAGILGNVDIDPQGRACGREWVAWVMAHEYRYSRRVRRLVEEVVAAGGDPLRYAHGGVYAMSRRAIEALRDSGGLEWRQPRWSTIFEDSVFSLLVQRAGLQVVSFGGPGEPFASVTGTMPLPLSEVVAENRLAVHTVRRGVDGESEADVRRFFRERRQTAATRAS